MPLPKNLLLNFLMSFAAGSKGTVYIGLMPKRANKARFFFEHISDVIRHLLRICIILFARDSAAF